jgi:hypothetical protein
MRLPFGVYTVFHGPPFSGNWLHKYAERYILAAIIIYQSENRRYLAGTHHITKSMTLFSIHRVQCLSNVFNHVPFAIDGKLG